MKRMDPSSHSEGVGAGGEDRRNAEPAERRIRMLRTAMGPQIAAALEDPDVVEVLLNPDGSLWVDRLGSGREPTGHKLPPPVAERIIRVVAAHMRAEVHPGAPLLSAEGRLYAGHSESFNHAADLVASCGRTVYRATHPGGAP